MAIEEVYRAYREVIAGGIRILRPHVEVAATGLDVLEQEIERFNPHVVICTVVPATARTGQRVAWVELSLESCRPSAICVGGRRSELYNPQLDVLLGVIDEAERLIGK